MARPEANESAPGRRHPEGEVGRHHEIIQETQEIPYGEGYVYWQQGQEQIVNPIMNDHRRRAHDAEAQDFQYLIFQYCFLHAP